MLMQPRLNSVPAFLRGPLFRRLHLWPQTFSMNQPDEFFASILQVLLDLSNVEGIK